MSKQPAGNDMSEKTMAEVLAGHDDWSWSPSTQSVRCVGCDWTVRIGPDEQGAVHFREHQAKSLDAAGYRKGDHYSFMSLAAAWASGYWHGTSHDGPLNDAAVDALNPYTDAA